MATGGRMSKFIVMEAASATPASWKWSGGPRGYRKVAVVETDGTQPKMISERAKGVVRIVKVWDRLFQGTTVRCEYERAIVQAYALADQLNEKAAGKPAA